MSGVASQGEQSPWPLAVRHSSPATCHATQRTPIHFGTDGWRAVIAEDFTFANVERVAQATADYWNQHPVPGTEKRVIIGYDRRFLSDQFARRTAEVLAGNGFRVTVSFEPVPTPAVSLAVKLWRAVGGIMITASHNPAAFNGFKLKTHSGAPADAAVCQGVEALLDHRPVQTLGWKEAAIGLLRSPDFKASHFRAIKNQVDFQLIARSRLRVAHDALFGVGAGCFAELLAGTTCCVTTLNGEHNPSFGGLSPEPIERNYAASRAFLRRHPHDVCLVTDGDADRIGAMDGEGGCLTTHDLICLLLQHFIRHRLGSSTRSGSGALECWSNGVVGFPVKSRHSNTPTPLHSTTPTLPPGRARGRRPVVVKALTTTSLVEKICAAHGLELVETPVGFKHIAAEMLKGNVLLGFEESGGIGFPDHIPERDGILAGLMVLELLATERQPIRRLLARLEKAFGPHRYARLDTRFPLEKRAALMDLCRSRPPDRLLRSPLAQVKSFDGVKFIARDGSWLMLRGSGTEPILRIYAEAGSAAAARRLVQLGRRLTRLV